MSERKSFLLRIDERVLDSVKRWADQDLRSLNAQVEFLLRDALRRAGRLQGENSSPPGEPEQP